MITKETMAKWAAKNRNALFLMVCVVLGQAFFYLTTTASKKRNANRYNALYLAGRVDTVLAYPRGLPRVRLATGETETIGATGAGRQGIQAGDSLVKEAGSGVITTYRRFSGYTEVSVFGRSGTDETGLVKRYRINRP